MSLSGLTFSPFFVFISFLSRFLCLVVFGKAVFLLGFLRSLCVSEPEEVVEFVEEVIAGILSDQEVRTFEEVIVPVFDICQGRIKDLDLCQPLLYSYLDVLLYFSHNKDIAKVRRHTDVFANQASPCKLAYSQSYLIATVSAHY